MQRSNERDHIDQHCEQSFSVIHMDASEDVRVLERKQKILQLLKKKELRIEEIKSELEDGPFINAVDMYGNSVLHLVIERIEDKRNEHIGFIQFLLDRGADLCLKNTGGYSPFLWAALKNKVGAMEVLAGCKRNVVNDINNNGDTALHLAIERDHIEAVAFLQELSKTHEFNMDIRSKGSHMTPRELALSKSPRNEKIVNILDGNFQDYYVKDRGQEPVACKPDVALVMTASGSLTRIQILADISSKYCKTANTSRVALQSYHWCHLRVNIRTWAKSVSNQTTFVV